MSANEKIKQASQITEVAQAAAAVANSAAADKLADAVKDVTSVPQTILDHIVGPKRIVNLAQARSEAALIKAETDAKIARLRAETADYVLDRETRKTVNRRLIVAEAYNSLPPPDEAISSEKPSEDFIHNFFDEFDGIGEPEMQKIVGRLLAGEVVRPGSFHRKTLRILRDLESPDFADFQKLCRFVWVVGQLQPVITDPNADIYARHGINFGVLTHLSNLGLIAFESLTGFAVTNLPDHLPAIYADKLVLVTLKAGQTSLGHGRVIFSKAGRQLARLANVESVDGFIDHVAGKWRADGHTVGDPQQLPPEAVATITRGVFRFTK